MDQYIGKMLDNRYEILERIGTGGMAVVYKAKCHYLNRLVAVKILKSDLAQDEDFRRRFNAESQAVAQLSHPNIVSVYDVSKGGDTEYIVMELIDGITLKQYMEKRGQLNWREALHFITQIMRALSHAHSRGIVHRDIKPQNIMVLRDGSVKVTDFGIACLENSAQTLTQEALGSVHYISPEQARGDRIDARSDIYSAGVVLYEMLAGRLPFEGDSAVSVAIQHLSSIPLAPREINPDIPEPLELICMKAMAADINKRYPSADAMIADLEAFRKNPDVDIGCTMEDLLPAEDDEPTQLLHTDRTVGHTENTPAHEYVRETPTVQERKRQKQRRVLLIGGLVVAIVLVVALFSVILRSFSGGTTEYTVPSVIGYTKEQAEALDGVKGIFTIDVADSQPSDQYAAGVIIAQDPEANRTKKSDLVIHVTVSTGQDTGEMPDVVNEEARYAEKVLLKQLKDSYNLSIETTEDYSDKITAGYIISTAPAAGETIQEGDTVTLVVSKGPKITKVTVSQYVGLNIDKVKEQLGDSLQCSVNLKDSDEAAGTILDQSIPVGTQVDKGSAIVFNVSSGLAAAATPASEVLTVPLPTDGRETVHVKVVQDGTVVADEAAVPCAQGNYAVELTGTGSSTVEVYIDDVLTSTSTITFGDT